MTRQNMLTLASVVLTVLAPAAAQVPAALASVFDAPTVSGVAAAAAATQPAGTPRGKQEAATGAAGTPAGTSAETGGAAIGVWSAKLPAASGPGRVITLTLTAPDSADLSIDYQNGKPPFVRAGSWQSKPGGAITVTLSGAPARQDAGPEVLRFQLQGDALSALAYDTEAWGKEGLRLVKRGGAGVSGARAAGATEGARLRRGRRKRGGSVRGGGGRVSPRAGAGDGGSVRGEGGRRSKRRFTGGRHAGIGRGGRRIRGEWPEAQEHPLALGRDPRR